METDDANNGALKNCSVLSKDEMLHHSLDTSFSSPLAPLDSSSSSPSNHHADQTIDPYSRSRHSNDDAVSFIDCERKNNENCTSCSRSHGESTRCTRNTNGDDDDDDDADNDQVNDDCHLMDEKSGNRLQHSSDHCNNKKPLLLPLMRCNYKKKLPTHIVIDCSMISYIDTSGVSTLRTIVKDFNSIGITTYLAGVATHVHRMLEIDCTFYEQVAPQHVYITLHDAIHHAQQDQLALTLHDNTLVNCHGKDTVSSQRQQCACLLNTVHPPPTPSPASPPSLPCNANDHQSIVNFFDQIPPGHT